MTLPLAELSLAIALKRKYHEGDKSIKRINHTAHRRFLEIIKNGE